MNLDQVTAKVRPRKGWEAVDLGVALAQRDLLSLYKIWFSITFPIFLLLNLLLHNHPWWLILIFWWFIPLYERPLLHWLSRVLFAESLSVKDCVKAFSKLALIQPLASLTWRRFSFTRSTDLPLIQLEGLKGKSRSDRLRVIHSMENGAAAWSSVVFLLVELILFFAAIALFYMMIPDVYREEFSLFHFWADDIPWWLYQLWLWLAWAAIGVVAPFYVACGFAVYINQRTLLESWDIELSFRKLAERLSHRRKSAASQLVSWVSAISVTLLFITTMPHLQAADKQQAPQAEAETTQTIKIQRQPTADDGKSLRAYIETKDHDGKIREIMLDAGNITHEQAKLLVEKIKTDDEFHQKLTDYRYQLRKEWRLDSDDDETSSSYANAGLGWSMLFSAVAWLVEKILWVLLFVFIIFLTIRYLPLLKSIKRNSIKKGYQPKTLFGLDVTQESLPEKPWLYAKQLITEGRHREALSLLYRASLVWFIQNTHIQIDEGDTELECLRKLQQSEHTKQLQFLEKLTQHWRALAYAHRNLDVDELKMLCNHWPFSTQHNNRSDVS